MTGFGDQPPPPPHVPPPPPPPHVPPPPPPPRQPPVPPPSPPAYTGPAGYTVDVDPESAGLERRERPGWALLFALLGTVAMLGSFALTWVETQRFVLYDRGVNGPLEGRSEFVGIFSAKETVEEVTGPVPGMGDTGTIAELTFPWGLIVLTVLVCVLGLAAAVGLRRTALTNLVRIVAVVLVVGTALLALVAFLDLGFEASDDGSSSPTTAAPSAPQEQGTQGEPEPELLDGEVEPHLGAYVWSLGAVLVAIAGALGPRVVHLLPAGTQPRGLTAAPGMAPPPTGPPGSVPSMAGGPMPAPGGLVRHTTQLVSVVLASAGAVLCLGGYAFLPWGEDTTFSEIGEAARDQGFGDLPFAEAYFAGLGWVLLLATIVSAVVITLGRKSAGVNPKVMRPILALSMIAAALAHLFVLMDLGGDVGDLDIGTHAVTLGLLLGALGAILPLRTSARVLVEHQHPPSHSR